MTEPSEEGASRDGLALDHSSDPRFLAYYAEASESQQTVERFSRIMATALGLVKEEGFEQTRLDVIDVGCGAGTQALIWAAAGHAVRAIDVNRPLVEVAERRAAERGLCVEFKVGSATELPYESNSADVVLLPELLEHVADWESCLLEAARVLRAGGLLYVSTSSRLCPVQQEFTLPFYSWYPSRVKRWCERKAMTTHPHWVNHARYPAVHWFTYYELRDWFTARRFRTLDRFDVLARKPLPPFRRAVVCLVQAAPALRLLGHVLTEGTTVWALKA